MATAAKSKLKSGSTMETLLSKAAERFDRAKSRREGAIHLQLLGAAGDDFLFSSDHHKTSVISSRGKTKAATSGGTVHIHITGDAERIRAVLEGRKDGAAAFVGGGIRVRGDLRYLSALASELGFIKKPF